MPTRTKSWAILSTARRLPERSRTLPADHLELSPYPLQSPVACVFKTPTRLDSEPIPTSFPPGYRPEARDSEGSAFNFFNPDHPIHHCVGSVGCSPYLSIREISMRTLCR